MNKQQKKIRWLGNEYRIIRQLHEELLRMGFPHNDSYNLLDIVQETVRIELEITGGDVKKHYMAPPLLEEKKNG